ncbi:MAG TPA: LolA family protein [Candidatus Tripitaka sp. YC43]
MNKVLFNRKSALGGVDSRQVFPGLLSTAYHEPRRVHGHAMYHRGAWLAMLPAWCMVACYLLLFVVWMAFASSSPLEAQSTSGGRDLESVLNEMEKANQSFVSMEAEVIYTRSIFLLEEEEVSDGKVYYQKPKKLRMEFKPPRDEVDVADGECLWVYHPQDKQVEKYRLSGSTAGEGETKELDFFQFGYEGSVRKAKENYHIELVSGSGKDTPYVLKLTPKGMEPPPQYMEIRLWVEEGLWLPIRMELYESGGEVINRIELRDIKLNRPLKEALFQFALPEGVEVVEPL